MRIPVATIGFVAGLGLAMVASAVMAQPRPSTLQMSCAQVRTLVGSRGAIVLGTGQFTYDRYVAHVGFCQRDETTEPAYERTADNPQCFIGSRCRQIVRERRGRW
jgi:hypothetical protein